MTRLRALDLTFLLGSLAASPVAFAGDGNPATSNVALGNLIVPYDGYLALDNRPMNGQLNLRFELYSAPTGGTVVWTEDQPAVSFYNGRFSVGLGSVTPITTTVLDAEKMYLAIKIDDGTGTHFALSGRQAIVPVPYAAWTANSADMNVAGNLAVRGNATLLKGATLSNKAPDTTTADGSPLLSMDGDRDWAFKQGGTGTAANLRLHNTQGTNSNLQIVTDGATQFQNQAGVLKASIDHTTGGATLTGGLGVGGNSSVTGNSVVTGTLAAGTTTINGDLTVTGNITNLVRSSEFTVARSSSGFSQVEMVPTSNSSCFLTMVHIDGLNSDGEANMCSIESGNNGSGINVWTVRATVSNGSGSEMNCGARCLEW